MAVPADAFPGFELVGELGRGTTGVIYDAVDTQINRRVALKAPFQASESMQQVETRRFLLESRVLASLNHSRLTGIPDLYAVAGLTGRQFYVRQQIKGASLRQLVVAGLMDSRSGLSVIAEVARVVQSVHEHGYIHRNLSATNVLVGSDGSSWLIGFGQVGIADDPQHSLSTTETPAKGDVHGLQDLVMWLCRSVRHPLPGGLERVIESGGVETAGEIAKVLNQYLQTVVLTQPVVEVADIPC